MDAIVTIEGKSAEVRHWSNESKITFCMDKADERLVNMVLIVSNASETTLAGRVGVGGGGEGGGGGGGGGTGGGGGGGAAGGGGGGEAPLRVRQGHRI